MSSNQELDDLFIFDDGPDNAPKREPWIVLMVDDEPEIHTVTRLALDGFVFEERPLEFVSANSAQEARAILSKPNDIAMAFVDVVMESDDAGLHLVQYIREELHNKTIRLILRTGQPGLAPEQFVIENYDIDDYKAKTDMTAQKLLTCVISALRTYKEMQRIEKIVEERTAEVREKNIVLSVLNRDLTDSIVYARRIQEAILPFEDILNNQIPQFSVFYEPKDIVSGDFYWFYNTGDEVLFAVVDCTGHGVPGAFMSVLGYSLLNQVVALWRSTRPDEILLHLDMLLRKSLRQDSRKMLNNTDGMDIALCSFNTKTKELKYAAARRPLYIFRDGGLTVVPGSRCSIGGDKVAFECYSILMHPGDQCYLFTDGITDQFGGHDSRKMMPRRFKEVLKQVAQMGFDKQMDTIRHQFEKFRGDQPQTDDILVLGMRVSA